VSGNILLRGCFHCKYSERFYLPALSKEVLYLDQFFLSHTFRAKLPEFVDAAKLIGELAHAQLLVCPFSTIHETETHQWRHPQQQRLWEFIKKTSRGQKFEPEYRINHKQIFRGFERFLSSDKSAFPVNVGDALLGDLNNWDDYFWIDVPRVPDNVELKRKLKKQSVDELVNIFGEVRKATTTFEEDRLIELRAAARSYLQCYLEMVNRLERGDFRAAIDSPVDTMIVEGLMHVDSDILDKAKRPKRIIAYFESPYFEEVPSEWISCGLFAVLKDRVKRGQYQNSNKAKEKLSGFFYDVKFISTYAPYCQAMFVDNAMFDFMNDKLLYLSSKFATRFFARSNWSDFLFYLESLWAKMTTELQNAIDLIYP
jgi:hypothetical protein